MNNWEKLKRVELIAWILYGIFLTVIVNSTITVTIARFKNPKLTGTELFLKSPQFFIYKFN